MEKLLKNKTFVRRSWTNKEEGRHTVMLRGTGFNLLFIFLTLPMVHLRTIMALPGQFMARPSDTDMTEWVYDELDKNLVVSKNISLALK